MSLTYNTATVESHYSWKARAIRPFGPSRFSPNLSPRSRHIVVIPLLEHLTIFRILDCVSSLHYLAGPISEAIKAGFGQLNAITGGSLSEVL